MIGFYLYTGIVFLFFYYHANTVSHKIWLRKHEATVILLWPQIVFFLLVYKISNLKWFGK